MPTFGSGELSGRQDEGGDCGWGRDVAERMKLAISVELFQVTSRPNVMQGEASRPGYELGQYCEIETSRCAELLEPR